MNPTPQKVTKGTSSIVACRNRGIRTYNHTRYNITNLEHILFPKLVSSAENNGTVLYSSWFVILIMNYFEKKFFLKLYNRRFFVIFRKLNLGKMV